MLNIGPGELIMICVVALIVLGPDKLPQAMRTGGQMMSQLRRLSSGFQQDIVQSFMEETENDRPGKELNRTSRNGTSSVEETSSSEDASTDDAVTVDDSSASDTASDHDGIDLTEDSQAADPQDQDADGNPRVA
jgi:sec-independent protein translocase protein TatB